MHPTRTVRWMLEHDTMGRFHSIILFVDNRRRDGEDRRGGADVHRAVRRMTSILVSGDAPNVVHKIPNLIEGGYTPIAWQLPMANVLDLVAAEDNLPATRW